MMAPAYEEQAVQAFPVHSGMFVGIASDESCTNRSVLHCASDSDVTFTFKDATTITLSMIAGMDVGLTRDVVSLTSTGDVWIG
jgi:hypothetical protein